MPEEKEKGSEMISKLLDVSKEAVGGLVLQLAEAVGLTGLSRNKKLQSYNAIITAVGKDPSDYSEDLIESTLGIRQATRETNSGLKQQENLESIVVGALPQIDNYQTRPALEEQWLDDFIDQAKTISSAEAQVIWSRLLAVETIQPGSISRRAMQQLKLFSNRDAQSLKAIAEMAVKSESGTFFIPGSTECNREDIFHASTIGLIANGILPFVCEQPDKYCDFGIFRSGTKIVAKNIDILPVHLPVIGLTNIASELLVLPELEVDPILEVELFRVLKADSMSTSMRVKLIEAEEL